MAAIVHVLPGENPGSRVYFNDGYAYHKNGVKVFTNVTKKTYLRCAKYYSESCHGRAILRKIEGDTFWESGQRHSCLRDFGLYPERLLKNHILRACRENLYESPVRVINRLGNRFAPAVAARVRPAHFRYSMRRARMRLYPPPPRNQIDLSVLLGDPNYYHLSATADGEDNMYCATVGSPGSRSTIFFSGRMRMFLPQVIMVFLDCTFVSTPVLTDATQLLQMVALIDNKIVPILQAIMESKSYEAYFAIFEHIHRIVPQFTPQKAMMDCEKSQMRAFFDVFHCKIVNCYVHFIRANLKKCGTLGLRRQLNNNIEAREVRDAFLTIPLVPEELFDTCIRVLLRHARLLGVDNVLEPYFHYFINTWMGTFRHTIRVFEEEERTNNPCESAHSMLQRETGAYHPSTWNFLNAVKTHEQRAFLDVVAYHLGLPFGRGRKRAARLNDAAIERYTRDLMDRSISVKRFLLLTSFRIRNLVDEYQ